MKLFCETSSVFELDNDNIKHAAMQRDFLNFCTWQHQKRSNSARLPHFLSWHHQKRSNSVRRPSKMESSVQSWRPRTKALSRFFDSSCLNCCACHKSATGSYEVLHLSCKIISANLKIWCSKMQPFSGNQRPDLLTSLINKCLVLRLLRKMHLCRSSSNVPRLPSFLEILQNPHVLFCSLLNKVHNPLCLPRESTSERPKVVRTPGVLTFWLRNVLRATMACTFSTSQLLKVVRTLCALCILTSKCASRHNSVHFFDISTSERDVFVAFSLANVLRATTACTFSISQLRKVVRTWGVFSFFYLQNLTNVLHATMLCTF